jgi:predicted metal-dependent phosphoesterase TrpH
MQKALGAERIIIGEEITTQEGEIIGLYLSDMIKPGLTVEATIGAIKSQNGLVYVPHPFENIRKGIQPETLQRIIDQVDIIETNNGRAITKKHSIEAQTWAVKNKIAACASSDAHGLSGAGHTYTNINSRPTKETLIAELSEATFVNNKPSIRSYLYPKINKFKKALKGFS